MPLLGSSSGSSEHSYRGNLDDFPNQFTLTPVVNLDPGQSGIATVTISGINYQAIVTATNNALISINNGPYATATLSLPRYIKNNQTLSVKFDTTSGNTSDFGKIYSTIISVGRVKSNWSVTTRSYDDTPNPVAFVDSNNLALNTVSNSNTVVISGLENGFATLSFITSGIGSFSINGSGPVTEGSIANGDNVYIQQRTANTYSTTNTTTLKIGSSSFKYNVTTRPVDTSITPFTFTNKTNVPINTLQDSNIVTISGADSGVSLPVSISSPGQVKINNGSFVFGATSCLNGDTITVRLPASALNTFGQTVTTTLNVSGYSTSFSATVRPAPIKTFPDQFTFSNRSGVQPLTVITSDDVRLFGMTAGNSGTASISGTSAEFRVIRNGTIVRNFSSSSFPVFVDDIITLRLTAGNENQTRQAIFTVSGTDTTTNLSGNPGQTSAIWSVTSGTLQCLLPTSILTNTFTDISNVEVNTIQTRFFIVSGLNSGCDNIITTSSAFSGIIKNGISSGSSTTIANGDIIQITLNSATTYSTERSTTITIRRPSGTDSISTIWRVTTIAEDILPNTFNLSAQNITNATPNTAYTIVAGTVSGLTSATRLSAIMSSTNSTALVSVNSTADSSFVSSTAAIVKNGDVIRLRMASDVSYGNITQTATLTLGNLTEQWSITTAPVPFPTVSIAATPNPAPFNGSSTITWSSTDATTVVSSDFGATSVNGSILVNNIIQNRDFNITVSNSRGSASAKATVFSSAPPAPTVGITVTPNTLISGGQATLSWTSTNATSVVNSTNFSATSVSGSTIIGPFNVISPQVFTYSITVQNSSGIQSQASATLTVNPPAPILIVTPQTATIPFDGSVSFSWNSVNATSMTANNFTIGSNEFSGSRTFTNITSPITYSITATNGSGSDTKTISVSTLAPPPTVTLTANPTNIPYKENSTLSWTLNGATSYTSDFGVSANNGNNGTYTVVGLTSTRTFTLTASNSSGTGSSTVTVNVQPCQVGISTSTYPLSFYESKSATIRFNNGTLTKTGYFIKTTDPNQRFTRPFLDNAIYDSPNNLVTRRAFTCSSLHRYIYNQFITRTGYPPNATVMVNVLNQFLLVNNLYVLLEDLIPLINVYVNQFINDNNSRGGIASFLDDCENNWLTSNPTPQLTSCVYNQITYTGEIILDDSTNNLRFTPGFIVFGNKTDNVFDDFAAPYNYYRSTINPNLPVPNRPGFTYGQVYDTIRNVYVRELKILPPTSELLAYFASFNNNTLNAWGDLIRLDRNITSVLQETKTQYVTLGNAYGQVDVCGNTFYKS